MDALIGPETTWRACAERYLAGLATPDGERYYGLFVRPFTTGLAWLSVTAMNSSMFCPLRKDAQ